jgi:dipeptidyl aminopeptidase/acylaminoacyl peptidase
MRPTSLISISVLCTAAAVSSADEADHLDPVAAAFSVASIWGVQLSPDGERLSHIQMHPSGVSIARVVDLTTAAVTPLVAGSRDSSVPRDVMWCDWANDTRLICGLRARGARVSGGQAAARLIGVDGDGGNLELLSGQRLGEWPTRPYHIVDWLPNDLERVLVTVRNGNGLGYNVAHLNVYDGNITDETHGPIQVVRWIADAHGEPRLYLRILGGERWYVRDTSNDPWSLLHETGLTDVDDAFIPIGFHDRQNELLFFDSYEGRRALFALDLDNERSRRLIYAHERLDITDVQRLGKDRRLVAATYVDDRPRFKFFDERVGKVHAALQALFVGKVVRIVDEDWNRRYYLVLVEGADDPGTYYRFDSEQNILLELLHAYPSLSGFELAPVRSVTYPADDGTPVPAYLTMPTGPITGPPPAVVLPHDGPASRDYWRFDFLAQYLAAKGYVVLQSNYRGSAGYGDEWAGQGGFRDWRRAVGDIADGADYLAREGLADANRICIVGWGYGGYAALMSVIENAGLYRCVASIAGITDTRKHGAVGLGYVGGLAERAFVGRSDDVLDAGSPMQRVDQIDVPVLLFHGRQDGDVLLKQSADLAKSLQRTRRDAQFVEYEYAEHDIRPAGDRLDLLTRLTSFLGEYLSPDRVASVVGARRPGAARPAEEAEEVTIRGQKPLSQYRLELEQAHAELVRIFNEENSGEDNDIRCWNEPPTGTRLRQRVCRSNAQSKAEANAARSLLNSLLTSAGALHGAGAAGSPQDSGGIGTAAAQTEAFVRGAESRAKVEEDLQRLQRENSRLYAAVLEYLELEDEYNRAREDTAP